MDIIGITEVRNEELILQDTLDHISKIVDGLIVFNDASTDSTLSILQKNNIVKEIITAEKWDRNRGKTEGLHRHTLLMKAKIYNPKWIFYFDADERFVGNIRNFMLQNILNPDILGIRVRFFDAYMTKTDQKPYKNGEKLLNFRKLFGPEYRDILVAFKNTDKISMNFPQAREPIGIPTNKLVYKFYCQHYGKSLSVKHWEDTCKFYADETDWVDPRYKPKWNARKGKAIHTVSDFDKPLITWDKIIKNEQTEINRLL